MFTIPFHSPPHSTIITVINRLALVALDIRLHTKFVEENIEALIFILGQADKAMIEW
jgi:hypothetical protein